MGKVGFIYEEHVMECSSKRFYHREVTTFEGSGLIPLPHLGLVPHTHGEKKLRNE